MLQSHHQILKPLTTAHLARTMTLLSLSVGELSQEIELELSNNPALELLDQRTCPHCHRVLQGRAPCPVCSAPKSLANDEPIIFISPRDDFSPRDSARQNEDYAEDDISPVEEDLPTYVFRQVATELAPNERKVAAYLLTHLDDDGLLTIDPIEVAQYFHLPLNQVQSIMLIIQRAEPVGVCSNSPEQAMLVQLDMLADGYDVPRYTREIIKENIDLVSRKQYSVLAKILSTSVKNIQFAIRFIVENLNPYPARAHWGDVRSPTQSRSLAYHQPDILIYPYNNDFNNPLVVEVILPLSGTLRVNPMFKSAIRTAESDKRDEWRSDLEQANLFIKCIQQRNYTIVRLMEKVATIQRECILNGEKHLIPTTRAKIAQALSVHESTISRAVGNKTVQLPNRRIVPLSSFFDRSLNVRTIVKEIITNESDPLSDAEIVDLLEAQGVTVARRTVAKYRAMEGILPAYMRSATT